MPWTNIKLKLHIKISILFAILMLFISAILIYSSYLHLTRVISHVNRIAFDRIIEDTASCLERDFNKISSELDILVKTHLTGSYKNDGFNHNIELLKASLDNNPSVNAVYVGYKSGKLLLIRRLLTLAGYEKYNPPKESYYVVTLSKPESENSGASLTFYDRDFKELLRVEDKEYRYNATTRGWYKEAVSSDKAIMSDPYVFYSTKEVGITIARNNASTDNVIGYDYTMDSLLVMVRKYSLSEDTRTILMNKDGQVLTANYRDKVVHESNGEYEIVTVDSIVDPVINDYAKIRHGSDNISFYSQGELWRGKQREFTLQESGDVFTVLTITPEKTLMVQASEYKRNLVLAGLLVILLILPIVWLVAVLIARPLVYLSEQLHRIKDFDFSTPVNIKSSVVEIDNLISSSTSMIGTIRKFQIIAETITKQKEYDELLNIVLRESTAIVHGKGAAVYLLDKNEEKLDIAALYMQEMSVKEKDKVLEKVRAAGSINKSFFEKYLGEETDFYYERDNEKYTDHNTILWSNFTSNEPLNMSIIRLSDSDGHMMGYIVFAHIKGSNQDEEGRSEMAFIKALSGFVSAAIEGQLLIEKRKELLESLIVLIADAVDAKSPYTGKHCHRVPVITRMIIEEACKSESPEYADYNLSAEEWEEIRIASWLHDCGKVVTPVDIVDKASKLECIYNRIHEIRMRFELLKTCADRDYWKELYKGGDKESLKEQTDKLKKELDEEFSFVAECNIGKEFMSDEAIERLKKIGERVWVRTIDSTLGLAEAELNLYGDLSRCNELPVEEKLLADKKEHIVIKELKNYDEGNESGFAMKEPDYKFNRGELYNLSTRRGTLTEEDRYIINAHTIHTINMLSTLPFPKHMNNIVEIAGSHHERMQGGGYPRSINASDLPLAARAMAIADIFEALTASDRPYKKGKTLSEALKIMSYMVKDQHIDRELFRLFVASGRAEEYARKFLLKDQLDEVNIAELLD